MLVIRLRRMGSKKRPFFRIVVTDSRAPRDSRAVELLGYYDPRKQPETLKVDHDAYERWVGKGARPSDTVRTLVGRHPAVPEENQEENTDENVAPEVEAAAATPPVEPAPAEPTPAEGATT